MKPVRIITIIAIFLLIAAGVEIAILYNSDAYKERQALQELPDDHALDADDIQQNGPENETGAGDQNGQETGTIPEQSTTADDEPESEPEPEPEPELRFIAVGDIMIGRGVEYWIKQSGSYEMAFEKIKPLLDPGDVVFGNLECPLTSSTKGLNKNGKIVLKGTPESVSALTSAGFNLLSLSNNHIMDYYEKGLFDTMDLLDQNGIIHAGGGRNLEEARELSIIEKNGLKIGLLAYTDMAEIIFAGDPYISFAAGEEKSGVVPRKYETIKEDIQKARDHVDLLAISLHWGVEESFRVTPDQVEFAHSLIDDGADIILGHHAHQFQGIEIYKGKPIMYSMGNILFDQNESENMESFIVDMRYKGTELTDLCTIPVRILKKSYVEVQKGDDAANILERQAELCRKLGTEPEVKDDMLVFK